MRREPIRKNPREKENWIRKEIRRLERKPKDDYERRLLEFFKRALSE